MNRFLQSLEITFRRDSQNFRPRINKMHSVKVCMSPLPHTLSSPPSSHTYPSFLFITLSFPLISYLPFLPPHLIPILCFPLSHTHPLLFLISYLPSPSTSSHTLSFPLISYLFPSPHTFPPHFMLIFTLSCAGCGAKEIRKLLLLGNLTLRTSL